MPVILLERVGVAAVQPERLAERRPARKVADVQLPGRPRVGKCGTAHPDDADDLDVKGVVPFLVRFIGDGPGGADGVIHHDVDDAEAVRGCVDDAPNGSVAAPQLGLLSARLPARAFRELIVAHRFGPESGGESWRGRREVPAGNNMHRVDEVLVKVVHVLQDAILHRG
jgi:hypothetical protein